MNFEDLLKEVLGGIGKQPENRPEMPGPKPLPEPTSTGGIGGVMHSVVQVVALRQGFLGGMSSAWTGSGTVIHPAGIILTNCHVASPREMGMSAPPADRLAIAVTDRSDQPPAISYFAEVLATDPQLDLAVIRIVADVRGQQVRNLSLPAIPIGDSDKLELGDRLAIFGYPGIGGETVTYTSGNVSGFTSEHGISAHRAWIKTDATIAGGNSGGSAVDESGYLVGIPTQAAAGTGVTPVDARPVLDTNRDGRIDSRDTPMAVGGFINGLRPVNLAKPLLEKAGIRVASSSTSAERPSIFDRTRHAEPARGNTPQFQELLFSTEVTSDGRPVGVSTNFPSGIPTVYATFEYSDLTNGTPWSVVWMTGGQQIIDQKDTWDDGEQGRKAVKISNKKGLPAGEYHLVLGIGGRVALEGKIMVGNPVDESDSEISGTVVDASSSRPIAGATVMVLTPEASLQNFLRVQNQADIYTMVESESSGKFTLPKQLPKGQAYSLIVVVKGYQPLTIESRVADIQRCSGTCGYWRDQIKSRLLIL